MQPQQQLIQPSVVRFAYYDPVLCEVQITSPDPKTVHLINSFIAASMTFYDKQKSRQWEVKEGFKTAFVTFYDKSTHLLPIGLIPRVSRLVINRFKSKIDLSKEIKDLFVAPYGTLTSSEIIGFANTLNLHNANTNKPIIPYEHQYKLAERALNGRRISLLACTSAGKSLAMCIIARYLISREKKKLLIVVPSTNLVKQLFTDFQDDYGWADARKYCTLIYSDSDDKLTKSKKEQLAKYGLGEDSVLKQITISTWQSLQRKPDKFFECFTAVMVDEAHSTRGVKLRDILTKCVNAADFKIGVSGTLPDDGIDAGYIESQLGRKEEIVRLKELVSKGVLTPVTVNAILIPYPPQLRKMICRQTYDDEVAFCSANTSRRDIIKILIDKNKINTSQNTVILFKNIEPLEVMHDYLKVNYPQFQYHIIKGDVSVDDRENIRKSIEYSTGHIILATYGCMKQGVNIKLLHNLVFAEPAKSIYMVVQSIGRVVRPHKDKKMAYVYDLVDDASYQYMSRSGYPCLKTNYMMKHYDIRRSYYDADEIPVNEINFSGLYEAKIDEEVIAERKRKAAEKAKAKAEKVQKAATKNVFKNKFFRKG